MPTVSLGIDSLAGFSREALVTAPQWPAAAPALVTAGLPVLGGTLSDGITTQPVETTANGLGASDQDIRSIAPTAQLSLALRYGGFEALWACALGHMAKRISGTVLPQALGGVVYRHLYEVDMTLSSQGLWLKTPDGFLDADGFNFATRKVRRGTLAVARGVSIWEVLSCLVNQLTITATPQGVTCTVDLAGYSLSRSSSTNTATTMAQAARSTAPTVLFTDLVARLGPYSTSTPLDSSNEVGLTQWSLTVKNSLAAGPGPRTGLHPEELERAALPLVTGQLTFARYEVDSFLAGWQAATVYALELLHTGPLIGLTGQHFQHNLYVPSLKLAKVDVPGPSATPPPQVLQFTAQGATGAAAGFPVLNHPGSQLAVELVGTESHHQLLAA